MSRQLAATDIDVSGSLDRDAHAPAADSDDAHDDAVIDDDFLSDLPGEYEHWLTSLG